MTLRPLLAGMALALVLSGCGDERRTTVHDPTSGSTATPTYDDAVTRARQVARETAAEVIGGSATLADLGVGDDPVTLFCSESSEPPRGTPVHVTFGYRLAGAHPARADDYFTSFQQHWSRAGWSRLYGSRAAAALALGHDDFVVLLQLAPSTGLLTVTVSTPCVAPKDPDDPLGP